jgi:flagellar hook-length control protein FliK
VVGRKVPPRDEADVPGRVGREVTTPRPPRGDAALPRNTVASAALALSTTGQLLGDVLRVAAARDSPALPDAAHNVTAPPARPLLGVPPHSEVATDRLALSIKDTVEFSGLFYESHLAQWADELRPRELLALEPQSKWPTSADGAAPATSSTGDTAAPLVRRQLDVLDTGRFLWRGDLWPGQPGALVIEEDDAPPRHDGDTAPPVVAARLRVELTLPGLGRVHASLGIFGDSLNVAVRCDEPGAAIALREAAPALRTAIGRRALDIGSIGITDGHA